MSEMDEELDRLNDPLNQIPVEREGMTIMAARRILAFLHGRVATLHDPRGIGEALKGFEGSKLGEFWKYAAARTVDDYRVIARIEDDASRVLAARVGTRNTVYR